MNSLFIVLDSSIKDVYKVASKHNLGTVRNEDSHNEKTLRKASMNKLYKFQVLLFLRFYAYITSAIIWSLIYAGTTYFSVLNMQSNQLQIQGTLDGLYRESLTYTELMEMILTNSTSSIRGTPIELDYERSLSQNYEILPLINRFTNSNGDLNTFQRSIFFGISCDHFKNINVTYLDSAETSCQVISEGMNKVGLATLESQNYLIGSQSYDLYKNSSKTKVQLNQLFGQVYSLVNDLTIVTIGSFQLLYDAYC